MFGTVFHICGMFCLCQHPGISLYFHLHSLSLAWCIQKILPLSRLYNKMYVKFQTVYKKLCNKTSNICSSTITVQILRVLSSSRKYKTNFKADIHNHIPVVITGSPLLPEFYGDTCTLLNYIYIYEHTVLNLHCILTRKIHIKIIIELNFSLCMLINAVIMNEVTRLLNTCFD
jgi:hypothetical protein